MLAWAITLRKVMNQVAVRTKELKKENINNKKITQHM